MVYAQMTDKPFVSKTRPAAKKTTAKSTQARWDYIDSHDFAVVTNPVTGKKEVRVTEKGCEN